MGGGSYNFASRSLRASTKSYNTASADNLGDVFTQKSIGRIHESLDPNGVVIRESRDSEEHPESYPIIIALDVTGSMGAIPAKMIRDGLPNMIQKIFEHGIDHPQVAFLGIGDHVYDRHPLQVGQFESSDELLDESLEKVYPEGGGGGNEGESYLLAWYHAAKHTSHDAFDKRGKKGVLVTIGDEPFLKSVPGEVVANLYGLQSEKDYNAEELLKEVSKTYNVVHINVGETYSGHQESTKKPWQNLLKGNFLNVEDHNDIPEVIANKVAEFYGAKSKTSSKTNVIPQEDEKPSDETSVML